MKFFIIIAFILYSGAGFAQTFGFGCLGFVSGFGDMVIRYMILKD